MKLFLTVFIAVIILAWHQQLQFPAYTASTSAIWIFYLEALFLSGVLSVALMSLIMVLATRPTWLEGLLGSMDKVYNLHKWSGILAIVFAAIHSFTIASADQGNKTIAFAIKALGDFTRKPPHSLEIGGKLKS